jgi:hypothetical protein
MMSSSLWLYGFLVSHSGGSKAEDVKEGAAPALVECHLGRPTTRTGGCGVHSEFQICVICLYMFLIIYE